MPNKQKLITFTSVGGKVFLKSQKNGIETDAGGDVSFSENGDGAGRVVVISSGRVTRNRDWEGNQIQLSPSGIRTDNFRNNPILLWMHMSRMPPIGTAVVFIEDGQLKARLEFHGKTELSKLVQELWDDGVLGATSIRINLSNEDVDKIQIENGILFIPSSDLVEVSVVTTPADAGAHRQSFRDKYGMEFSVETVSIVEDLLFMDDEREVLQEAEIHSEDSQSFEDAGVQDEIELEEDGLEIEFDENAIDELRQALGVEDLLQELNELRNRVESLEGEPVFTTNIRKARFSIARKESQEERAVSLPKPSRKEASKNGRQSSASTFIKRSRRA